MKSHLKNQFAEFVIRKELFTPGDHVLVTVSGGVDSMVLLDLLFHWKKRLKISLGAVHLNHQLRPVFAQKDQALVDKVCMDLKIPLFILSKDVGGYARRKKLSIEEAGHLLREELFLEIANGHGYQKIATAHHRDDQAETVLMRILGGTGLKGLAAIRLRKGRWVRPLLWATRKEIEQYAISKGIQYRKDESNEDVSFRRNKIRQTLLPLLKSEYDPAVSKHLAQFSEILEEWDTYVSKQLEEIFPKYVNVVSQNEISVELTFFQLYFSWIQHQMIEFILDKLHQNRYHINFNQYQDLVHWVKTGRIGSKFQLSREIYCVKRKTKLNFRVEKESKVLDEIYIEPGKSYLLSPGNIKISLVEISKNEVEFSSDSTIEYLAAETLKFPLLLRTWRSGDAFRPLGSNFYKKVSDFLADKKIGFPDRQQIYVLLNQDEIVAVLGHRISNVYRIKNDTRKVYRLKIEIVGK